MVAVFVILSVTPVLVVYYFSLQFLHRGMKISMDHPLAGSGRVDLIGNPVKLSKTPVSYRRPPPTLGQHTDEVLSEVLDLDQARLARLKEDEVI